MVKFAQFLSILLIKFVITISPIEPTPATVISETCKANCSSPYGSVIGRYNNVTAFSNCNDNCINWDDSGVSWTRNLTGLARDVFVGIRWQCVEYARRYLIINYNSAFTSIDSAFQIFNLTEVNDLTTNEGTFEFRTFPNGDSTPPEIGDLIISPEKPGYPVGHVAVVSEVDLKAGYVALAEQNFFNKQWENSGAYSRRIMLHNCEGRYVLTETPWNLIKSKSGKNDKICIEDLKDVLGWKRVILVKEK